MNKNLREQQLISIAKSVIESDTYKDEFNFLLNEYQMTENELIEGFLTYNTSKEIWDSNDIYKIKEIRPVLHLHNCVQGSWHQERQEAIDDLLHYEKPNTVIDIAFGVPGKYIKKILKNKETPHITLCDREIDAFLFSEKLLKYWSTNWRKNISFAYIDMDDLKFPGNFDIYILQDAIEHTKDPEKFLELLLEKSPKNAKFIFSLPICKLMGMHTIAWETVESAKNWLSVHGLEIEQEKIVSPNKDIDLFSNDLDGSIADFYSLCSKNKS